MTTTVWYIGEAFQRIVTSEDWASKGITSEDTFWGPANGWAVPQSSLTEEQITILDNDSEFMIGQSGPRSLQQPASPTSNALLNSFAYYNATLEVYNKILEDVDQAIENWKTELHIGEVGQELVRADTAQDIYEFLQPLFADDLAADVDTAVGAMFTDNGDSTWSFG